MSNSRGILGRRGEEIAAAYLRRRGYQIFERNWIYRSRTSGQLVGELDIVAQKGKDIVFVEVKAGSGKNPAWRPEVHVNEAKQRKLRKSAQLWLSAHNKLHAPHQIDVIAVDFVSEGLSRVRHTPHAIGEKDSWKRSS